MTKLIDPAWVDAARRIECQYCEDPGLQLSSLQASNFFGTEAAVCHAILIALVAAGILSRTRRGMFVRASPVRRPSEVA